LEGYREALKISQRLAREFPKDTEAQRDLSISLERIGDVLLFQGDLQLASEKYRESLEITQRLADDGDNQAHFDLTIAFNKSGDVFLLLGQGQQALDQFRKGHKIRQQLAEADRANFGAQIHLV